MTTTSTPPTHRSHPTIAVIGGTGHTGRRVAARLRDRGYGVRIGSRAGSTAFSWEDPATWGPVLDGCRAAYVAYAPDLAFPCADAVVGALAPQAARHGLERLVLLSGRGEPLAARAEGAVRAAGVPTAVVRASWFAQNFSEHWLLGPVLEGVIALPAGDMAEPFLDLEDLADVATRLLVEGRPRDVTVELTGPRALTFAEAAAELSDVIGRPVRYQPVTSDEFVEGAVADGMPREEAEGLAVVFEQVLDGRNASPTSGVRDVLGRAATDFSTYARRTAADGAWALAAEPTS
jgi:uncharacterized protein YbjT (DUF2867 family)